MKSEKTDWKKRAKSAEQALAALRGQIDDKGDNGKYDFWVLKDNVWVPPPKDLMG